MKFLFISIIVFFSVFHISAYIFGRSNFAEIWLTDCFDTPKKSCTKYSGSLKRSFIWRNYIISENGKEIYIKKEQVGLIKWE